MEVEIAVLCREADIETKIKGTFESHEFLDTLCLPKVFSIVTTEVLPLRLDGEAIFRLRIPAAEAGTHRYKIEALGPRRENLLRRPVEVSVDIPVERFNQGLFQNWVWEYVVFPLRPFTVTYDGEHTVELFWDGVHRATVPLLVRLED